MNRKEFVEAVAMEMDVNKAVATESVNVVLEVIKEVLAEGDSIQFTGFGTFSVNERAARKGRNPSTGESIDIAARNVVKFKVGASLKEAVN